MRTTLTLDDDVAALLEKMRRAKGQSFKQIVNEALRAGLRQLTAPGQRRHRFKTRHVDLAELRIVQVTRSAFRERIFKVIH